MKFEYAKLVGYMGIYQGTLRREVEIEFGHNRITMIKGPNGCGKSTLLSALSVYPDNNGCFIPKEKAEKILIVNNNGRRYKINIVHGINSKGDRETVKGYIKKEEQGDWVEQNPTGTIGTYKDYIETEFDLDPNFISLSFLSTETKGLVKKTPGERIKMVSSIVQYVEVYNNMLKVINKRISVYKSLLNKVVEKIELVGNQEQLEADMNRTLESLNALYTERSMIVDAISKDKAAISLADPDSSIQNLYSSIQITLDRIEREIESFKANEKYLLEQITFLSREELASSELTSAAYLRFKESINSAKMRMDMLSTELNGYLNDREEENRAISILVNRIESLQSEYNYDTLITLLEKNRKNKEQYEEIFNDIHIKNAINISKDEYITGLNTLNDIKDTIRAIQSSSYNDDIKLTIDMMKGNKNIATECDNQRKVVDSISERISTTKEQISYYQGLCDKVAILSNRPSKCKIDSCSFIAESLEAVKKNPEENLCRLNTELDELQHSYKVEEDLLNSLNNCLEIYHQLNMMLRNVQNNSGIISKLPVGNEFLDNNALLDAIYNNSNFEEIDELYKYINCANIFEEYKYTIDTLKDLEAEYKIYETKSSSIDDLNKELSRLNEKLNGIVEKIDVVNNEINDLKVVVDGSATKFELLDSLVSIQSKLDKCYANKKDYENQLNTVSENMQGIQVCLNNIQQNEIKLAELDKVIAPLEEQKTSIKYSMGMLKEYEMERESYGKSYNMLEVLKEYSSPTKKGIQNLFIKVYMAQTLKLANDLLKLFFGGRLTLLPYTIEDGEFSIPCYSSYTGITTDDVSHCSRSEKAMVELAMSGALMMQGSSKYNIFKIDEVDEGLDVSNRMAFLEACDTICEILHVEQMLMISHTSELNVSNNVDVIKMRANTELGEMGGNVICEI